MFLFSIVCFIGVVTAQTTNLCQGPGDIAFAIDGSDSITDTDFQRMINFTLKNIESFELGTNRIRVGGLVYSSSVENDYFSAFVDRNAIENRIRGFIQPRMGTRTDLAIDKFRTDILASSRTRVGVVITDGVSLLPSLTNASATAARAANITLVAVGIAVNQAGLQELRVIAGNDDLVKIIDSYSSLGSLTTIAEVRDLLCTVITTTTTTTTTTTRTTTTTSTTTTPPRLSTDRVVIDSLCEGCVIDDGFGYNKFMGDCSKFVQCFTSRDANGNQIVTSSIQQCGFATYWSQEKLTCVKYDETTCAINLCQGLPDGVTFPYLGYRSYWLCLGGKPLPMCCPSDQIFQNGNCVADVGGLYTNVVCPPDRRLDAQPLCMRTRNPADDTTYFETVNGITHLRSCAPGTLYNENTCLCATHSNLIISPQVCSPLIKQGNNAAVGTQGVLVNQFIGRQSQEIRYGYRFIDDTTSTDYLGFLGTNSALNLWTLANYDFRDKFAIRFMIDVTAFVGAAGSEIEQVMLNCLHSNLGANAQMSDPSISIQVQKSVGNSFVFIGSLKTKTQLTKTLNNALVSNGGFVEVIMAYDGINFVLKVNGNEVFVPLTGDIELRQTGFVFGRPILDNIGIQYLDGKIKNIVIYDCIAPEIQNALANI